MMISHTHRFIFIHVYKTGGSSIFVAFSPYGVAEGLPYHPLAKEVKAIIKEGGTEIYCDSYPALTEVSDAWDRYFKFAFVRNPYDYVVSLYSWLKINTSHDMHSYINSITFHDFVKTLENPELEPEEFHHGSALLYRRPLSEFIEDDEGNVIVDFVGRFETLERDYGRICERLFIPQIKLPRANASPRPQDYREFYDESSKRIIQELFKKDLESFGYEF